MTQNTEDTTADAPSDAPADSPEVGLTDEQVADYLTDNPDFLAENADLLSVMTPPKRWSGDGVVDMQGFLMERLKGEIDNLRSCAQEVIETSRVNMANQTRVHTASLAVLAATDFEHMVRIVNDDLPLILDVDVVSLGFEPAEPPIAALAPGLASETIRSLDAGAVDDLMQAGKATLLLPEITDDGTLFGSGAGLARSAAFARLHPSRQLPAGLLALGARGADTFHAGQGTELLGFLARVLERCLARWLEPPA